MWFQALIAAMLLLACSSEGSDVSKVPKVRALAATPAPGTNISIGQGAKWNSYPFCGLNTENDEKCTQLLNSLFIPQQWGAVGRAFVYINDNKDYGLGCQNPGKCKVITNPFVGNSKKAKVFKPLQIVKLTKPATVVAPATFQKTSQLQVNGAKIGLKATWTFASQSYLDVSGGAQLSIDGGSLQGRVAAVQVRDSTLLVAKKASSLAGPALFTGSTVTQTSASFSLVDTKPVSNSPKVVSIVNTTWTVGSSSQLIFDSREVYVSMTRFYLSNSVLMLNNTKLQIFDSSLFLTNSMIWLDQSSSLSLYNYRIVGDLFVSATNIFGVKPLVGQPLKSSDNYSVSGPGYISLKSS